MNAWKNDLRANGFARMGRLFTTEDCRELRALYGQEERFRSRIEMERFRFGRGEYKYFAYPLPACVERARSSLYAELAPVATQWMKDLGDSTKYPLEFAEFLNQCKSAGQTKPTALLLRYRKGDYNCLHQDLYGDVVFPFQVVVGLSAEGADYEGGELLLMEQRPRAQSKGTAIRLIQGEALVITTRYRPAQGSRGFYRANMRHGVSEVTSGERYTLGIVFHDAR